MGSRLKLIILLLFPSFLFSQSEGGFGFRRFANTANLTATSVNNSDKNASRRGYVHATGLYYRWNGSAWVIEETIDTFSISGNTLSLSILNDGVPAKTVDLGINLQCDNIISPASFSTSQDNFNPAGLTGACEIRLTTTAQSNITGIEAQVDGYELVLTNEGNHPITLSDNVTSTAANRFLIGYNYNLGSKQSVKIRYDGTALRWRVVDNLSLGSGSGRIAGGRSQNVYWSYQTDTLNDFALGYFTNGTSDDKTTFGKFGLHIDGDGGFSIGGKETYIKGSNFDLLTTSYISARESAYDMASYSRLVVGGTENFSNLVGTAALNAWTLDNGTTEVYDLLQIGTKKDWSGTPSNKKDYGFLYQGGGHTGSDTSAISIWWGIPQLTDTVGTPANSLVRGYSKERGWGVQSLFDRNGGTPNATTKFDWIKVYMGSVPADTAIHSSGKDGITFYGNKWEIPNETPSSVAGDSSVILWTSPFNSFFIDIDDIKGSSVNIYNSDGTQDDADRYFTQDSTRTFAMGQFTSVSTPTWGRGYYYDPSTSNGIRILNKNGANTTTAIIELDPETINTTTTHTTSSVTNSQFSLNESSQFITTSDRTSDTHGSLIITSLTNSSEEQVALKQSGKSTALGVVMYLGTGNATGQYSQYTGRAWGVQTNRTPNPGFDWIQILLPDTGTDTTGNNINFYNRKYYWSNETPSFTNLDTMVHVWIGNGTNATPDFINLVDFVSGYENNIYNSNGTTTQNTRTATILESIRWVGTANFNEPFPFQVISTGTEPNIQNWKGNSDSVWVKQNDTDYEFFSSAILTVGSDDYLALQADSLLFSTVADKTKMKYILGKTPTNSVVEFDGDAATIGDGIISNGVDWTISPTMERTTTTSGAGTLNLGTSTAYIFTGTTTTWTLPTVAGNTNKVYFIKNRGSGAITLNSNAGGNDIYTTSAVNTITINAGESALLWNDGTYFLEMY